MRLTPDAAVSSDAATSTPFNNGRINLHSGMGLTCRHVKLSMLGCLIAV